MSITVNTADQLKSNIVNQYKDAVPGLDLSDGSTENDILVSSVVDGALSPLEQQIGYVNLVQSLNNWQLMQSDDLENLVANVLGANPRLQATKSSGTAFFYTSSLPLVNISIKSGSLISTIDGVQFVTTADAIIFASIGSTYYDATLNLWGIEVPIQSVGSGSTQNIAAGLITVLVTSISGISVVSTKLPTTGGIDQESNQSLVNRAINSFQSRGLESLLGLQTYVKQQSGVIDAFAIDGSSPLMVRDDGLGGKCDLYIRGQILSSYVDNFINTSTGYFQLTQAPLYSISSVIGNRNYVTGIDYNVVTSTGAYVNSTKQITRIVWTSSGVATLGESISITYNYNKLLNDLQTLLVAPQNKIPNRDLLLFQTTQVIINVSVSIFISGDQATIIAAIETSLGNYVNNLPLSSTIEKIQMLSLIDNVNGVSNVDTSSFIMTPTGGGTISVIGDIVLQAKEYSVLATPVITIKT